MTAPPNSAPDERMATLAESWVKQYALTMHGAHPKFSDEAEAAFRKALSDHLAQHRALMQETEDWKRKANNAARIAGERHDIIATLTAQLERLKTAADVVTRDLATFPDARGDQRISVAVDDLRALAQETTEKGAEIVEEERRREIDDNGQFGVGA